VVCRLVPGPTLFKATLFAVALALPFDIFVPTNVSTPGVMALALTNLWESAFEFSGPLGTVPPYHMPIEFRVLLALLPVVAAGLGIATWVAILDRRLPRSSEPRLLESAYGFLTVIGGIGLLFLPIVTGLIQIGGDYTRARKRDGGGIR
jgi:hypothetical protein